MSYEKHILGQKQYELTDHLGDVLATISDKRVADSLTGSHRMGALDTIQTYKPVVVSATDYYPFGMQMPGRYMCDTATHSFNTTLVETIPYFIYRYFPFPGAYPTVSYVGTGYPTSLMSGDLLLNTTSTGDGLTMTIDSLDPYVSQTITLVTGGSSTLLSPVAYTAQIISGTVLASYAVGDGGTYVMPFTPDGTSVTLTITQTSTYSGTLDLLGIYLPRF
ncbi:MAG TPA: hypothetical protein VNZ45_13550, partial [Bacteroidia bacterium]|nr:hypothetical protein [Bacteroidia bacterium]